MAKYLAMTIKLTVSKVYDDFKRQRKEQIEADKEKD